LFSYQGVTSRKKPVLLVGERESSLFRLVRLSVGVFGMLDHEIRSGLCCATKLVEGMGQERTKLVAEDVMFNCGVGVSWRMKIFVEASNGIAIILLPSADEAKRPQN